MRQIWRNPEETAINSPNRAISSKFPPKRLTGAISPSIRMVFFGLPPFGGKTHKPYLGPTQAVERECQPTRRDPPNVRTTVVDNTHPAIFCACTGAANFHGHFDRNQKSKTQLPMHVSVQVTVLLPNTRACAESVR